MNQQHWYHLYLQDCAALASADSMQHLVASANTAVDALMAREERLRTSMALLERWMPPQFDYRRLGPPEHKQRVSIIRDLARAGNEVSMQLAELHQMLSEPTNDSLHRELGRCIDRELEQRVVVTCGKVEQLAAELQRRAQEAHAAGLRALEEKQRAEDEAKRHATEALAAEARVAEARTALMDRERSLRELMVLIGEWLPPKFNQDWLGTPADERRNQIVRTIEELRDEISMRLQETHEELRDEISMRLQETQKARQEPSEAALLHSRGQFSIREIKERADSAFTTARQLVVERENEMKAARAAEQRALEERKRVAEVSIWTVWICTGWICLVFALLLVGGWILGWCSPARG